MDSTIPDPNPEDLCIRIALQQLLSSSQAIIGDFKSSSFNIVHEVLRQQIATILP
jgi:hypothetical protein